MGRLRVQRSCDLPQSPGRTHDKGRASVRMVDHARHVATAQYCSARGAPGHKAVLPLTAAGYVTQHALRCDRPDAWRASTSHTHTVARPHAMRPSRPGALHASSKSCRELGRARHTKPIMLATLRQLSATRARDNRSAQWLDCGRTPTLAIRTGQPSSIMVASNFDRSATAAHGYRYTR